MKFIGDGTWLGSVLRHPSPGERGELLQPGKDKGIWRVACNGFSRKCPLNPDQENQEYKASF